MWALTGSVVILAVIVMYYRRKYKVTKLVNAGGRSIIQISQDADSENIMMGIFYGPYDERLPLNSIVPMEELVEEEDYTEPVYDLGREFWDKVRNIRSAKTETEARAIAERLVNLSLLADEDIPRFLGLDESGRWHAAEEEPEPAETEKPAEESKPDEEPAVIEEGKTEPASKPEEVSKETKTPPPPKKPETRPPSSTPLRSTPTPPSTVTVAQKEKTLFEKMLEPVEI